MSSSAPVSGLVGSATRYIAGRNAVQTVYWRVNKGAAGMKMIKYNKTFKFGNTKEVPSQIKVPSDIKFKS